MQVHYRLPNMGWHDDQTCELEQLWTNTWMHDQLIVSTEAEYDYLMGMGLVMGKELEVIWDPAMKRAGPLSTMLWIKSINTHDTNPRRVT